MEKINSIRVFISGRVQGVFFRAETKKMADSVGIKGWVRNMPDGRVEAVFQGNDEQLSRMTEWCKKGPRLSRVTGIEVSDEMVPEEFTSFEITY